jgi:hypothetical protein
LAVFSRFRACFSRYSIPVELSKPAVELYRFSVEPSRMSVELYRLSVELSKMSVDLYRVSVELSKMSVELYRVSVEVYRLSVELSESAVELYRSAKLVPDTVALPPKSFFVFIYNSLHLVYQSAYAILPVFWTPKLEKPTATNLPLP